MQHVRLIVWMNLDQPNMADLRNFIHANVSKIGWKEFVSALHENPILSRYEKNEVAVKRVFGELMVFVSVDSWLHGNGKLVADERIFGWPEGETNETKPQFDKTITFSSFWVPPPGVERLAGMYICGGEEYWMTATWENKEGGRWHLEGQAQTLEFCANLLRGFLEGSSIPVSNWSAKQRVNVRPQ